MRSEEARCLGGKHDRGAGVRAGKSFGRFFVLTADVISKVIFCVRKRVSKEVIRIRLPVGSTILPSGVSLL